MVPALIAIMVVAGLLVSNYQKEVGIAEPNKAGRDAVAAGAVALGLSAGTGASDYAAFAHALRVALVANRNMPLTNPADIRLDHQLAAILDCLSAAREAWQTELDGTWNPDTHGLVAYWMALHPSAGITGGALTAAGVRETAAARARELLQDAADLAE